MTNRARSTTACPEWFTPPVILDCVAAALGAIDLDPASHPSAPAWQYARTSWSRDDDGLTRPWAGRVFCNPPFAKGEIARWVAAFIAAAESGDMRAGILLTEASTTARWFHALAGYPRCLLRRRVKFINGTTGKPAGSPFVGHMLVYSGPDLSRFIAAMQSIGDVYPGAIEAQPRISDKRRSVLALLADPASIGLSDRSLARRAGVSHPFVAKLRRGNVASLEAEA